MFVSKQNICLSLLHRLTNIRMAAKTAKTRRFTHVRVSFENRERAKEIARAMAQKEHRDVYYTHLIDEILSEAFGVYEKQLGIKRPKK